MVVMDGQNQIPSGAARRRRSVPNVSRMEEDKKLSRKENLLEGSPKFLGNPHQIEKGRVLADKAFVDNAIKVLFQKGISDPENPEIINAWQAAQERVRENAEFIKAYDPTVKELIDGMVPSQAPLDLGFNWIRSQGQLRDLRSAIPVHIFNNLNKYVLGEQGDTAVSLGELKVSQLNMDETRKEILYQSLSIMQLYRKIEEERLSKKLESEIPEISISFRERTREEFLTAIKNGQSVVGWRLAPKEDLSFGLCLAGVDLRGVEFNGANLSRAVFVSSNLSTADFSDCDLTGSKFQLCNMKKACFVEADLSASEMKFNNCSEAGFRDCILENLKIWGSHLDKVSGFNPPNSLELVLTSLEES